MAKFSACYRLCPLIDQKSFLGVTDESINGCVIITLGKNMVIRYKLSDQKQVSSWSSKDKLSAPVVYDPVGQTYVGVFNANQISTWEDSCVQLNKLKKFKFTTSIECVLTSPSSSSPVVVFRNGHILPLKQALGRRKEHLPKDLPLSEDETITDAHLITLIGSAVVALFTVTSQGKHNLHLIPVEKGLLAQSCVQLERKSEPKLELIGHALVTYESCQLLTLWSDGKLFSLDLPTPGTEQFPGRNLATLTNINSQHQAAILSLSPTHLAIYGADVSEEGALLFIFNSQLCITQCEQYFKLYTTPAKLWAGGKGAVLVADGQHLVVVPFYLGKQRLAALVGSQDTESRQITQATWDSAVKNQVKQEDDPKKSYLQKMIESCMEEGMSQRMICQSVFLPTLDSSDVDGLTNLLQTVTDIPESCIIAVIDFCLKEIEEPGYRKLLRTTLAMPVTADLTTLRLLRNKLILSSTLILLKELSSAMIETPGDPQLVEWATLLLDSHYQQYLLSRDSAVIETLTELKAVVNKQVVDMQVWQELEPLLLQLKNKQGFPDPTHHTNTTYCIEQLALY